MYISLYKIYNCEAYVLTIKCYHCVLQYEKIRFALWELQQFWIKSAYISWWMIGTWSAARFEQYKRKREFIDKHEGGLEAFSRGYEKMGFTKRYATVLLLMIIMSNIFNSLSVKS